MFRTAPRLIARQGALRAVPRASLPARRFISTAPPAQKSRSWKSLVARLGLAGAIIYYYNTTDISAEPRLDLAPALPTTEVESETLPTIESISAERAQRKAVQQQLELQRQKEASAAEEAARAQQQQSSSHAEPQEGGIEGLEAEADQQGAFNPETGEINWDCPCLGGMATGPCGEEFKAAFSCFVYSKEEPKGMDCIDKFKDMQNCFRQYPEVYGSEIDADDDDDDDMTADAAADVSTPSDSQPTLSGEKNTGSPSPASNATDAPVAKEPVTKASKSKSVVPASSGPHSAEKVAENRRELGLVPENYRP
ncbi:hypothetical protein BU25DRAFT_305655, partial [Macroventuria anomochaeta]